MYSLFRRYVTSVHKPFRRLRPLATMLELHQKPKPSNAPTPTSLSSPSVIIRRLDDSLSLRHGTFKDFEQVVSWFSDDGFPKTTHSDAANYSCMQSNGLFMLTHQERSIAALSTVQYPELNQQWLGYYYVVPEFRNPSQQPTYGKRLWDEVMDYTQGSTSSYGLCCLPPLYPKYLRYGFQESRVDVMWSYQADTVQKNNPPPIDRTLTEEDIFDIFPELCRFDLEYFGADRKAFLRHWILDKPETRTLIILDDKKRVSGYSVLSEYQSKKTEEINGYRIGPMIAKNPGDAEQLFLSQMHSFEGKPNRRLFIETNGLNGQANCLLARLKFTSIGRLSIMYKGQRPSPPVDELYAHTSLGISPH